MPRQNIEGEIKKLQLQLKQKEDLFDYGMKNEKEFAEMKKLYREIKDVKMQLAKLETAGQLQNN